MNAQTYLYEVKLFREAYKHNGDVIVNLSGYFPDTLPPRVAFRNMIFATRPSGTFRTEFIMDAKSSSAKCLGASRSKISSANRPCPKRPVRNVRVQNVQ